MTAAETAPTVATVGVVAALAAEARWLDGVRGPPDSPLRVLVSGVGARAAQRAAERLLADGARSLVSWGTAAGLHPTLAPGTLLIADRVLADAAATTALEPTLAWADRLATALQGVVPVARGTMACPRAVLRTAADKSALARASGAIGADMESAAIGRVAEAAGVAWIVVRVVSDGWDATVPESVVAAVGNDGAIRLGRLARAVLARPSDLRAFPALARGMRVAGRTMRRAAPVLACGGREA